MKQIVIAIIGLMSMSLTASADVKDLPVKTVDGHSYYYYEVQPKETIYSLCRRLNITKEQLIAANPDVGTEGLKAYSVLLFPVSASAVKSVSQVKEAPRTNPATSEEGTHTVLKGETIYGICRQYGITPAQLTAWNPNIREGLKAGMVVIVSGSAAHQHPVDKNAIAETPVQAQPESQSDDNGFELYTVKEKETFYSIAHSHGISVAELEEANPETGILKAGQTLKIPAKTGPKAKPQETIDINAPALEISVPGNNQRQEALQPAVGESDEKKEINIAVILPFMSEAASQPRQSQLYTEFYKGFLLAVDSMKNCGTPINIYAFDTADSPDTLRNILSRPELKNVSLIIPPDDEEQIKSIVKFGEDNGISVLNLFAIRDASYMTHANVYQANIPHQSMYDKAMTGIVKDMNGRIPVIITPADGTSDKHEFIQKLKNRFDGAGIEYKTIEYTTALTLDDLAQLDQGKQYAFLPSSGKQSDLNRMLPALIEFKNGMTGFDPVRLYGYPEWTTFRGETLENMHAINTYIYSRFFTVPDDPWAAEVQDAFIRWYGVPMGSYVPRQGLLGFDTAMYLIGALRNDNPVSLYNGVQNGFHFVRPSGVEGYVNDDLYFVNFRPSGLIDRIEL